MNAPMNNMNMPGYPQQPVKRRAYLPHKSKVPLIAVVPAVIAILGVLLCIVLLFMSEVGEAGGMLVSTLLSALPAVGLLVGAVLMGAGKPVGFGVTAAVLAAMELFSIISRFMTIFMAGGISMAQLFISVLPMFVVLVLYVVTAVVGFMCAAGRMGSNIPGVVLPFIAFVIALVSFIISVYSYAGIMEYFFAFGLYLVAGASIAPLMPLGLGIMGAAFKMGIPSVAPTVPQYGYPQPPINNENSQIQY